MEASILFGLGFSPKDTAYSGREVVMKKSGFAPKKNTNLSTGVCCYFSFCVIARNEVILFVAQLVYSLCDGARSSQ
jgi:hypothetical protein